MPSTHSGQLVPAVMAQCTAESLRSERGGQIWIYWLMLIGVLGSFVCLPLVEVDVSVSAPGIVRPATERSGLRVSLGRGIAVTNCDTFVTLRLVVSRAAAFLSALTDPSK